VLPRETLRQRNVGSFKFCETGTAALEECSFNFPDIVFVDESLPDMTGETLLEKIIQDDANAFVVLLQSRVTTHMVQRTKTKGGKGIITKPFSASSFDRYIQFFFKEKYKKSWNEVEAFSDKGRHIRS
jgi:CheY-like chemotaxis protein